MQLSTPVLTKTRGAGSDQLDGAFKKAQDRVKRSKRQEAVPVFYDRIFTSETELKAVFAGIVGSILDIGYGYTFFWQKTAGEPVLLFGKKERLVEVTAICTLHAPKEWTGVGLFKVEYPTTLETEGKKELLLHFFLYSAHPADLLSLLEEDVKRNIPYLASVYIVDDNVERFYAMAAKRFADLR